MKNKTPLGLYIHLPFCLTKCIYCDFYSNQFNIDIAKAYKSAVIRNVLHYFEHERLSFDTIYFGGGTPSVIWREVAEIAEIIIKNNPVTPIEVTVEANPADINPETLNAFLKAGINRISIGVQSLNDNNLRFLGRRRDGETAVNAVKLAHEVGFENISIDLMLGLPKEADLDSLNALVNLPINHISAYMLKVEENTPLAKNREALKLLPDENKTADEYLKVVEFLEANGFKQYEISNFSRINFECAHNLKYWKRLEYIGIGAAAHSYYNNRRFAVEKDAQAFVNSPLQQTYITEEFWGASPIKSFEELVMLRLRLNRGLVFSKVEARFKDYDISLELNKFIKELRERAKLIPPELIIVDEKGIRLTAKGFLISNSIIGELLS